jgi:DNA (cytosine-5)-methyltransferase 1
MSAYGAGLTQAWRAAMAPRQAHAPTVISLFAGGGGSSLGYTMAGYRELLAVEWDGYAAQTFRMTFPDTPVWEGDIASLSIEEVLSLTGLVSGELDVLDGSPPCQGFSTGGKRVLSDHLNTLLTE